MLRASMFAPMVVGFTTSVAVCAEDARQLTCEGTMIEPAATSQTTETVKLTLGRAQKVTLDLGEGAISARVQDPDSRATGIMRGTGDGRLLLQYVPGDYNCLHQDLYGDLAFPIQVATLLSEPGVDFAGGEFVLTEQRPRMQSRAEVVSLLKGDAVAFAVHHRPVRGTKGNYRVNLRHGVSRVRSGMRHTVGIIFHDAT